MCITQRKSIVYERCGKEFVAMVKLLCGESYFGFWRITVELLSGKLSNAMNIFTILKQDSPLKIEAKNFS